jgi:hypothetical protein
VGSCRYKLSYLLPPRYLRKMARESPCRKRETARTEVREASVPGNFQLDGRHHLTSHNRGKEVAIRTGGRFGHLHARTLVLRATISSRDRGRLCRAHRPCTVGAPSGQRCGHILRGSGAGCDLQLWGTDALTTSSPANIKVRSAAEPDTPVHGMPLDPHDAVARSRHIPLPKCQLARQGAAQLLAAHHLRRRCRLNPLSLSHAASCLSPAANFNPSSH